MKVRRCLGFGKTQTSLVQLVHLARVEGAGVMFVDPHRDGARDFKPYLTEIGERVLELDLDDSSPGRRHVTWNPVSMHDKPIERMYQRAQMLVDIAAIVGSWGKGAPRSRQIATATFMALATLSRRVDPESSPTILSGMRLLEDEQWRDAVVPFLPPSQRAWWETTFPSYGPDATAVLTNALRRLTASDVARATLGSAVGTYDARRAMDLGMAVLAITGSGKDRALNPLVVFDAITAAKSRTDLANEHRKPFWIVTDEAQSWDDGELIPELVQETGKYGVRLTALTQNPMTLTEATRRALGTNASLLMSTSQDVEGDKWFTTQMGAEAPGLLQAAEKYHFLAVTTQNAKRSAPFRVGGLSLQDAFRDLHHPERLPELEALMDRAFRPRTIRESLALVESHEDRVLHALRNSAGAPVPDLPPLEAPARFGDTVFD